MTTRHTANHALSRDVTAQRTPPQCPKPGQE